MADKAEKEVVQEAPAPTTAPPAPEAQAQNTELTVNDLNNIKQIIDVASSRGAFKPNEMMTVGQVYNKLETFLATVAQQQPPQGE